jgi:hypothetical protein
MAEELAKFVVGITNKIKYMRTLLTALIGTIAISSCSLLGSKKATIPPGAYALDKSQGNGFSKLLHGLAEAGTIAKGLGSRLIVTGDSVESIDIVSSLVRDATGGKNKFKIENTSADNQFFIDLPDNKTLLEVTSQGKLKIFVGQDSLVYQKE